ncbi:Aminoglycoside phosphotransferase [Cordyceps javanica]|uniref:Aminoglycoside phosphotransferase n=1 Tax=Cordyceps javanica TaxID=43265 RepID=A0A545ULT6_9HYPO|nr:Aminoglycoside phosphotransferase [Cordyceps javanica]
MITRNLLSGPITLSEAKLKSSNVMHALRFSLEKREFYARIERQRHLLSRTIAHHLNIDVARVTVSEQDAWIHGSFNLCVPALVDEASPVLLRFPLPYRVEDVTSPGNADEKVRAEAATYAWIHDNCPDVPIPQLYGFGLSTKQQASLRFLISHTQVVFPGICQPSQLVPHDAAHGTSLDVGYLLIQIIVTGRILSDSWSENCHDTRLQANLQRDIARVMLSLAAVGPLPCVGTFRIDDCGYLRLDNRPLSIESTKAENEGIPIHMHRRQTFTSVRDFVLSHIDIFSCRLLHQPNGTNSRDDACYQMASLAGARALFPQLFRHELDRGPFVFALTDLHRSNIIVDDDWNIVCIIDLEFACAWPVEFVQPPYWLGGEALDEVTIQSFKKLHEGFIEHIERREALLPTATGGQEPLSATMRQGWTLGTFWVTLAVMDPIAFTEVFYDRILRDFMGVSEEELNKVDHTLFARFWHSNIDEVIDSKLRDFDAYNKQLDLLFAESTD